VSPYTEPQPAEPYKTILNNHDDGTVLVLVSEHSKETARLAALEAANNTCLAELDDATPLATAWLADTAEPEFLRKHTKDPDGECFCDDESWCPDADGERGAFWIFHVSCIEDADDRAADERSGEVSG